MTEPQLIRVADLHKRYYDVKGADLHILRGVELTVQKGESVAIMGASGAGKSTLLHLLGALDTPDSGTLHVDGASLGGLSEEERARFRNETIGFVFQFHHLLMDFSALENVMMPMWIRAGKTLPFDREAMALLDEVGLAERAGHRPSQLSGGEQQRLAIARAIANRPRILLADEPTGNLDEDTGNRVAELLHRLIDHHSLTLILVTHSPSFAGQMSRVFQLEHGQLTPLSLHRSHG